MFTMFVMIGLWHSIQKKSLAKREKMVTDLKSGILIYTDVARAFLTKCIKSVLLNFINEPDLDLSVHDLPSKVGTTLSHSQKSRIIRLQVRIKGVIEGILKNCNYQDFPQPLAKFLGHLTGNGNFMPDEILTNFEISRLHLDTYGALQKMNFEKQTMIISFFLFTKILVAQIFLQPEKFAGISQNISGNTKTCLKTIATFIQALIVDKFLSQLELVRPINDPNDDGIREHLLKQKDIKPFFLHCDEIWLNQVQTLLAEILAKISTMVYNFDSQKKTAVQKSPGIRSNKTMIERRPTLKPSQSMMEL